MDFEDHLEHFSLRWNNYNDTMKTGFHDLLQREDFVDVTIAAEGKLIQAHKMVLSICSPYFKTIFKTNPCQHPVVFLKDVTHKELSGILQFMYLGEVSIKQEDLGGFLRTAEALQIKGLSSEETQQVIPPENYNAGEEGEEMDTKDIIEKSKIKMLPMDDDYDGFGHSIRNDEREGVERKKMKMSSPDEGLAAIDPHVPVIRTPERPANFNNSLPPLVVVKDEPPELDFYADECERASVVQENHVNHPNQASHGNLQIHGSHEDDEDTGDAGNDENDENCGYHCSEEREDFAEEIINSLTIGNGAEIAQEVNQFQPIAEMYNPGDNQQGTAFPTRLKKNQGLCPICGRIMQHKKNLQTHILDQHSGIFGCWPCQICHRVCRTWSALRVHTNRHHLNLPPAAVQMSIIGIPQHSN